MREVAEMANALTFIESNFEDLKKEDVQKEVEKTFNEFANKPEIDSHFPNFHKLQKMYEVDNAFTIEEL